MAEHSHPQDNESLFIGGGGTHSWSIEDSQDGRQRVVSRDVEVLRKQRDGRYLVRKNIETVSENGIEVAIASSMLRLLHFTAWMDADLDGVIGADEILRFSLRFGSAQSVESESDEWAPESPIPTTSRWPVLPEGLVPPGLDGSAAPEQSVVLTDLDGDGIAEKIVFTEVHLGGGYGTSTLVAVFQRSSGAWRRIYGQEFQGSRFGEFDWEDTQDGLALISSPSRVTYQAGLDAPRLAFSLQNYRSLGGWSLSCTASQCEATELPLPGVDGSVDIDGDGRPELKLFSVDTTDGPGQSDIYRLEDGQFTPLLSRPELAALFILRPSPFIENEGLALVGVTGDGGSLLAYQWQPSSEDQPGRFNEVHQVVFDPSTLSQMWWRSMGYQEEEGLNSITVHGRIFVYSSETGFREVSGE